MSEFLSIQTTSLRCSLCFEAFQVGFGEVHVLHRRSNPAVTCLFTNQPDHFVGNSTITRVPLRTRAQLNEVHGLTGVHLHDVSNPKGQRDAVLRLVRELFSYLVEEIRRAKERLLVALGQTGFENHFGRVKPEAGGERRPLDGEQTVPLQVPEGSVVTHNFKSIVRALKGPSRTVTAISSLTDVGRQYGRLLQLVHRLHAPSSLVV